ncbi:peptide MFS transporter [Campylobacter helveticus]|uniref:Peptide MFS transporter n=1 Tax=Campylobacter helveticus TaxID=28898 RepID=A0ABY3KZN0_9BACT|nr:peptide MFS transporter [Campylobacter helveticus]ARE79975.1 dipeptide/tripeptide permease [Campylobacter helveticus]MCR2040361.1 peptide MFS transporter [Campylobacter helveticus]MCR2057390.1 peptide MFS transporter [Campylobacter helveticus]MCR2060974.1 peptide MFS transporter [Campylobacter helveticus]MCR2066493.1 peptide MFS transporter [Campylobacter helveticus]
MQQEINHQKIDKAFLGHPKPLFALSATELWERFSFYGIRPLLVLFMTATLLSGGLGMSKEEASAIAGIFGGCIYLAALPGGWLADNYLGQKKAVFIGCVIIALGHLSIALSYFISPLFFVGLALIVIGTGLFKTCSSVMVGMMYDKKDARRDSGFTIFYMGINIGGFIAPLVTGFLQTQYGWHLGFGAGGIGMLIALCIFAFKAVPDFKEFDEKVGMSEAWDKPTVRNKNAIYVIVIFLVALVGFAILGMGGIINLNPVAIAESMTMIILWCAGLYFLYLFFLASLTKDEKKNLIVFVVLFFAAAVFWSVFEQQYTTYNFFADKLTNKVAFGYEIPTVWFQSINSLFIILLAPVVGAIWVFLAKRKFELSSLTKFSLGLIGAGVGFLIMAFAASGIISNNGGAENAVSAVASGSAILASPWWLVGSFLFLTLGELCLSPVGLSIMTRIAPKLIKSQVMGLWFVSISVGNVLAGLIGGHANEENLASLPDLFYQCVWILFAVAVVLLILKKFIKKLEN